ncbi:DUF4232 domain-containing protein [Streptomyces bathyalis]|uniref:DUF4232 domain-containing protein n=1 Tax=Streptomyces bathyalis TaxID=2710756 RepID=A0A7T1T7H2_9ACTN|nr:DUF4232 domain-containing protein [Streptomyces bathyalis]QPP07815.1 DUF4232 domain-containing protein [Streptomyces bathyalis]
MSTTVLAACLVITGCGPEDKSGAPATPTSSTSSPDDPSKGAGGKGKDNQGAGEGGSAGGEAGDGGTGNHKPDPKACTSKNSSITIRTSVGSGKGAIQLINNSGKECSVYGAPNLVLKSSGGVVLNDDPRTDETKEAPLVAVPPNGGLVSADLSYESGPVSEGGSQDGITCGDAAASAEVSNQDATWQAEIRANEPGNADPVEDGMIVCGPKTTVGPFQE